ncbi:MAG: discoidin domain-containing protein [bacterium]|nr:discoidin domain-containing protein [bacterium]
MKKKIYIVLLALFLLLPLFFDDVVIVVKADEIVRDYGVDLAFGRRVVSTPNTDSNYNIRALDDNPSTRYAASPVDNAYFYVDLGSVEKIGKIVIDWEAAYAQEYYIQLSNDAVTWTTVASITNTRRTMDTIEFPTWLEAKFVRFQGVKRATQWGYSFYSFEVYGPRSKALGANVVEVSSYENETLLPKTAIVDNLASSRWASNVNAGDFQYLIIDLGSEMTFDKVKIRWEVSFARRFVIYGHANTSAVPLRGDSNWEMLVQSDVGLGEVDDFSLSQVASTRFIKIELIQRETSEVTKKTGRLPWQSTFSIHSFEIFDWQSIQAVPLGNIMEFSKNSPAWAAMTNMTLEQSGLILAPIGYPIQADGVVTNLASIANGDIPGFESYAVYNPAVIYDDEREIFHMIYRSELPDNFSSYFGSKYELGHMSTLSYAYSYDGVNYTRGANNPIAWPTTNDERGGGVEDPRMFKIVNDPNRGGKTTYYITYTMYDNHVTREGIIYTHDFVTFIKVGRLAPNFTAFGGAIKSGAFVTDPEGNAVLINDPRPGKVGMVYMMYMKDGSYTRIGFTKDVLYIHENDIVDIDTGGFGSNSIEALTKNNESCMALTNLFGPDDEDIYLMYGGGTLSNSNIQFSLPNVNGWFYALGVLKTTKSNPFELTNITMDLDEPSIYPTDTNKIDYGLFDKCMFADTMIRVKNEWYLYYGAGDMYVGLARSRGDFGAGAAEFSMTSNGLKANTYALHRSYQEDKQARNIEFVLQLFDFNHQLISEVISAYSIQHFSQSILGSYSIGEFVEVSMDLSSILTLPSNYYVSAFIRDAQSFEKLNNISTYTVVQPVITRVNK